VEEFQARRDVLAYPEQRRPVAVADATLRQMAASDA
jgi:hypothetical protein